jgi:hypothetical protein
LRVLRGDASTSLSRPFGVIARSSFRVAQRLVGFLHISERLAAALIVVGVQFLGLAPVG